MGHPVSKGFKMDHRFVVAFGLQDLDIFPDKPVVHISTPVVHSGEGQPAILECSVHADPRANVAWYKNTLLIDNRSVMLH